MKLEDAKKQQNEFKSNLIQTLKGRYKSEEQNNALESIKLLYESRKAVIESFHRYFLIYSEAKHEAKYERGLKKFTSKQILQRLPIALAQVKTGYTPKYVLNEIRQIIFVSSKRNY